MKKAERSKNLAEYFTNVGYHALEAVILGRLTPYQANYILYWLRNIKLSKDYKYKSGQDKIYHVFRNCKWLKNKLGKEHKYIDIKI